MCAPADGWWQKGGQMTSAVTQNEVRRYLAKRAEELGCSFEVAVRSQRVFDERLADWGRDLLSRVYRRVCPGGWAEMQENYFDAVTHDIQEALWPFLARLFTGDPNIEHHEASIKASFVYKRAATRNLLQHFYARISNPGSWACSVGINGEVRYRNTDLQVNTGVLRSAFRVPLGDDGLDSLSDPAEIVEYCEEDDQQNELAELWLERVRKTTTTRQYQIVAMVVRDGLTVEQAAEVLGQTPRNVQRCIERFLPTAEREGASAREILAKRG